MGGFNNTRLLTARKNHRCEWCGEAIPFREQHLQYVGTWEGAFQSWRMHQECYDAASPDELNEGFTPYEHDRPAS